MNEFSKQLRDKGWRVKDLAERWGFTLAGISKITANPKQMHWDALKGLPKRKLDRVRQGD